MYSTVEFLKEYSTFKYILVSPKNKLVFHATISSSNRTEQKRTGQEQEDKITKKRGETEGERGSGNKKDYCTVECRP